MEDEGQGQHYYVVRENAVSKILLDVVQAKTLLATGKASSATEASKMVGISRSSFYKYKDDIFLFDEKARGKTITLVISLSDEPGMLSSVLRAIADCRGNILTIHQSIPINEKATLTVSVRMALGEGNPEDMVSQIERMKGIDEVKLLGSE